MQFEDPERNGMRSVPQIADLQLPIADWSIAGTLIGNRQLTIGNVEPTRYRAVILT
jgi:hypothetical protein